MVDVEELGAILDIAVFDDELDDLLRKLSEVALAIQGVNRMSVRVDVDDSELDTLMAKMAGTGVAGIVPSGGGGRTGTDAGDVSDAMKKTTRAAKEASEGFDITNLRMTDMHNALAKLVPLIVVLIGALPALIGALVGLAGAAIAATAALAAITGFGALGFAIQQAGVDNIGEGFREIMRDIRESFLDAFAPLAERLAPLFEDALDGLDRFFQAIADRGDVLVAFGDAARDLGGFILDRFPDIIAFIGEVATAFVPVFEHFADLLGQADIGEGFMQFMADVLPAFSDFIQLFAAIIPHILGLSIGFLQVTNAILLFLNVLFDVITLGGALNEEIGFLIASLLTLVSVWAIWNSQLFVTAGAALAKLGTAIVGAVVGMLELAGATGAATAAAQSLTLWTAILTGGLSLLAGLAVVGVIGGIADKFNILGSNINNATRELQNFQSVSNRVSDTNPYGTADVPERGSLRGGGRNQVNVTVEGDADKDELQNQTKNANFRMSRTGSTL